MKLTVTFQEFFNSEKAGGVLLLACTVVSLSVANSPLGDAYVSFWQAKATGLSIEHWINDGLMAIFFLLVGLELKRELLVGELSNVKSAMLPVIAAVGGIVVPAAIHWGFNADLPTRAGAGIPMATDIAFALGVLALVGSKVPAALKVFLAALAVIDDLGAILVIAAFYTAELSTLHLLGAVVVFAVLCALGRFGVTALTPYLVGGAMMWFFMLHSGVHATIAGVLLALAVPSKQCGERTAASVRLEGALHKPVAYVVLPLFALANTALVLPTNWIDSIYVPNGIGIVAGLLVGKPLGITLFTVGAVSLGLCRLPSQVRWAHIAGVGLLGGIGFTMSIFVANLAFPNDPALIDSSKIAILLASSLAGIAGFLCLKIFVKTPSGVQTAADQNQ